MDATRPTRERGDHRARGWPTGAPPALAEHSEGKSDVWRGGGAESRQLSQISGGTPDGSEAPTTEAGHPAWLGGRGSPEGAAGGSPVVPVFISNEWRERQLRFAVAGIFVVEYGCLQGECHVADLTVRKLMGKTRFPVSLKLALFAAYCLSVTVASFPAAVTGGEGEEPDTEHVVTDQFGHPLRYFTYWKLQDAEALIREYQLSGRGVELEWFRDACPAYLQRDCEGTLDPNFGYGEGSFAWCLDGLRNLVGKIAGELLQARYHARVLQLPPEQPWQPTGISYPREAVSSARDKLQQLIHKREQVLEAAHRLLEEMEREGKRRCPPERLTRRRPEPAPSPTGPDLLIGSHDHGGTQTIHMPPQDTGVTIPLTPSDQVTLPPTPLETGPRPPAEPDSTGIPPTLPQTGGGDQGLKVASCCEACPGTAYYRFYVPIEPETDCQPGDVRRDDLSVDAGTCANPLTETPTPEVFANAPATYGPACCAGKKDQVLYDSQQTGSVKSDVGSALRAACDDDPCAGRAEAAPGTPMRLETSILSIGNDTHGRNWVPENATLKVGKERLKPCHTEPFYVTKESTQRGAAVAVFAALGREDDAERAEASPGTACHGGAGGSARHETPQERAAKAAALGLLAAQAKGQLEGLRATFDVTGREDALQHVNLQSDIVNEITQRRERLALPMEFDSGSPQEDDSDHSRSRPSR